MKLQVRIGYSEPYLPTPRCTKYRFEKKEEMMELELKEVPASDLVHAFDVKYRESWNDKEEHPWSILKTRIYRHKQDGKYEYYREANVRDIPGGGANFSVWAVKNPLRHIESELRLGNRFVLHNDRNCREFLIREATAYLDQFLFVDNVLYIKTELPVWRVRSDARDHRVSVYVAMNDDQSIPHPDITVLNYPWHAKDEAMEYAKQEAKRVGASAIRWSENEAVIEIKSRIMACIHYEDVMNPWIECLVYVPNRFADAALAAVRKGIDMFHEETNQETYGQCIELALAAADVPYLIEYCEYDEDTDEPYLFWNAHVSEVTNCETFKIIKA